MKTKQVILKVVASVLMVLVLAACVYTDTAEMMQGQTGMGIVNEPIIIGEGTRWQLDGMLTLPADASAQSPVPAIVIVAGSGPNNMDGYLPGSQYAIQIYYQMANLLAENGIATIRWDKRTHTHGLEMMTELGDAFGINEEYTYDAILATEILRADPRVDSSRIFALGHSQGGMVLPRIHLNGGDYAGLILVATSPASMIDLLIRQINEQKETILAMIPPSDYATIELALEPLMPFIALFDNALEVQAQIPYMTAEQAKATPLYVLGSSAFYYFDLMGENSLENLAPHVNEPILVLHAGRDFQANMADDWPLMQQLFGNMPNATMRVYDNLNHILAPSIATNHLEHAIEIMTTNMQMDRGLIRGIAQWVLSQ
ncbi:MAG: lysophospholipase [Defluviitaleaceae bacterium]|nr:lysophospholipase [Defluviitaleaceae bacterium]